MQTDDRAEFDRLMTTLCIGFDTPPTKDRKDSFWIALQKMHLHEFKRCTEYALGENGPEKFPTANAIWRMRAKLRTGDRQGITPAIDTSFATAQEQLCEYASLKLHGPAGPIIGLSLWQHSRPCTYVYRQWIDKSAAFNEAGKCAECVGVIIETDDGRRIGFSVAQMLADDEYAKVKRVFLGPHPRATEAQRQLHREFKTRREANLPSSIEQRPHDDLRNA